MSVSRMEHVLVLCDDVERTREFYCEVVGLRLGDRPKLAFPGYWLYAGDTPCVHTSPTGRPTSPTRGGSVFP